MISIELTGQSILVAAISSGVILSLWVRVFLRITMLSAFLTCVVINGIIAGWLGTRGVGSVFPGPQGVPRVDDNAAMTMVVSLFVAINLAVAMIARVYRCAVLQKATVEERTAGVIGVRAWLSPANVVTAVCLAIAAYMSVEYSVAGTLLISFSLLLAYPLMNTLLNQPMENALQSQAPNDERQRVLAMVETGKITTEDATELLSALAQSHVAEIGTSRVISVPRRIMLAGASALLLGFLLPWFTLNESQAMHDVMNSVQQTAQTFAFPGQTTPPPMFSQSQPDGGTTVRNALQITLSGGDVRNGLGWIALATGLGAAALPFFWTARPHTANLHRSIVLTAMAIGTVAMLYLLSNSLNSITQIEPGFILSLVAYALIWVGAIREHVVGMQRSQPKLLATA